MALVTVAARPKGFPVVRGLISPTVCLSLACHPVKVGQSE